ncbi:MAG: DUF424 family protein [Candidatus Nanoarchaeia archaeon]
MLVKIHKAYRDVIAICDSDLIGKKFEDGKKQIDLTGNFFKGEEKNEEEVKDIMRAGSEEDACFNIVGKQACQLAKEEGIIKEEGIKQISNVDVALGLL